MIYFRLLFESNIKKILNKNIFQNVKDIQSDVKVKAKYLIKKNKLFVYFLSANFCN